VLATNRFVVEDEAATDFTERAHAALTALGARPGFRRGRLLRALDDPRHWSLLTEWESVGSYRRALGAFEVKIDATPLLAESLDEPSAYETLADLAPGGSISVTASDRAADPGR
jgi:hypothetical protein